MKILSNPILLAVLGVLLGAGTSVGVIWTAAQPLVKAVAVKRSVAKKSARPERPWDFWTIEIESLATELRDQKAALKQREESVSVREARLTAEQQELAKTRQQLEAIRNEIASKMTEVTADEAKNLKTLANTYSNLAPKTAVNILKEMDVVTVVKVFSVMKSEEVSALFEEMGKSGDPVLSKRAAQIAERLRLLKSSKTTTASTRP